MAHIPHDCEWFYATLVVKITVEDDPRIVVHRNTVLVNASDPESAYRRALELGRAQEDDDINPLGKRVQTSFLGLGSLGVIHEPLEHGAELFYSEDVGLSADEAARFTRSKAELEAFSTITPSDGPDYSSVGVVHEARKLIRRGQNGGGQSN